MLRIITNGTKVTRINGEAARLALTKNKVRRGRIDQYNDQRTHCGKHCFGKTPMQTLKDSIPLALAKQLDQTLLTSDLVVT